MDARTTWPALLNALLDGESLTAEETAWAMNEIMSGEATDVQIAGFAVAMRAKGETIAGGRTVALLPHVALLPRHLGHFSPPPGLLSLH